MALAAAIGCGGGRKDYGGELGRWIPSQPMPGARSHHTATLLEGGEVLVTGGLVAGGATSADSLLYDPATETWHPTGMMATARANHTATKLLSGKVLVAGGVHLASLTDTDTPEIYDPASGSWSPTPPIPQDTVAAMLLPSGEVLAEGEIGAARYDPDADAWSAADPPPVVSARYAIVQIPSGIPLVMGGIGCGQPDFSGCGFPIPTISSLTNAQAFDHVWTMWPRLLQARDSQSATVLLNGDVLVVGGEYRICGRSTEMQTTLDTAEVLHTTFLTWAPAGSLATPRMSHTATLLASGDVLIAGGESAPMGAVLGSADVYHADDGTWEKAAALPEPRVAHTATLLPSGSVLVIGGDGPQGLYRAPTATMFLFTEQILGR